MAKSSIYDDVVDELVSRQSLVRDELIKRFKKTKPFRMESVSDEEMLLEYNVQGEKVFNEVANKGGLPAGINYIREMEGLKRKIQGGTK